MFVTQIEPPRLTPSAWARASSVLTHLPRPHLCPQVSVAIGRFARPPGTVARGPSRSHNPSGTISGRRTSPPRLASHPRTPMPHLRVTTVPIAVQPGTTTRPRKSVAELAFLRGREFQVRTPRSFAIPSSLPLLRVSAPAVIMTAPAPERPADGVDLEASRAGTVAPARAAADVCHWRIQDATGRRTTRPRIVNPTSVWARSQASPPAASAPTARRAAEPSVGGADRQWGGDAYRRRSPAVSGCARRTHGQPRG
jgi:hypothetical protein